VSFLEEVRIAARLLLWLIIWGIQIVPIFALAPMVRRCAWAIATQYKIWELPQYTEAAMMCAIVLSGVLTLIVVMELDRFSLTPVLTPEKGAGLREEKVVTGLRSKGR
jgi:hypothetical protein